MLKFIAFALFLYTLACVFLYVKQRNLLYFPTVENNNTNAESLWIQTSQENLKVWLINKAGTEKTNSAIIYFGGNSEQVADNIIDFNNMFTGFSVYIVNYRGYGGSSGTPTQQGLFDDALAIYDHIKSQHSTISVIGRSLGSGVASYLAAKRDVLKLVLTTPYDSINNVAQSHYPLFPVKWLMKDKFDSVSYAPTINSQILVLYAEHDLIIPMKHTQNLLTVLPEAKSLMIEGATHNDISSTIQYQKSLADFMNF